MGAQNIIQEFINSLDREVAPQLAENLTSLYEYFIRRLIHANLKKKIEPIDEVLKYLKSLKATWEQAIILAQKEQQEKQKHPAYYNIFTCKHISYRIFLLHYRYCQKNKK